MYTTGRPVPEEPIRSVLRSSELDREWKSCPAGHVSFIPAQLPLEWSWSYASDSIHLTLSPSFLDAVAVELGQEGVRSASLSPFFRVFSPQLAELMRTLADESSQLGLGADLVTSSLLTVLGVQLLRTGDTPSPSLAPPPGGLSAVHRRRSLELITERLGENLSLADLAAECELSPFHFARAFKVTFGFPPHEYQLQLRVARARTLLGQETGRTIADIASELGFADESHFRRHFRRIVGTTPRRFRDDQRGPNR